MASSYLLHTIGRMSVVPATFTPESPRTPIAAQVAFWSSAAFIGLLAALHVLRPDLDPSWRFISEYELGDYGWMMQLAFACLAMSCLALCAAIWRDARGIAGYLGMGMVVVAAAGMIIAAHFVPDKVNRLHEVGAMLDQVPFAAPLINLQLFWHKRWKPYWPTLLVTAGIPLLGLAIFIGSMVIMLPRNAGQPGPEVLVGWPNRIMILAHCAWLMPLAWIAWRIAKRPANSPAA